eukprot:Protomagalhaensia_sp_Gyna_25__5346@NODE_679_length_2852_cov_6_474938_g530_i0_p2_GENE_NODE_679_length_2852_cov_6_474938_g530_i0NODE_679_length_2852_cov_6_474938_g530_i0_p2_ORF_typecomplete_len265_score17_27zinc_ribbon_5/PF13719_6/4_2e02zinc_ribbon_5/PF13719_6/50zinc_ribbon_5/PF13719_6/63_NODE_679_length_2852_cov_6_474938_g530_i0203997
MKSQYNREDLESFKYLERDLSQLIPTPLLERFKALRPWYLLKRQKIKEAIEGREVPAKGSRELQRILEERNPVKWSAEWGAECDHVFKLLNPGQVLLLRHYADESKTMMQTACGIDPQLVSGVDRQLLDKAVDTTPQRPNMIYDTRTRVMRVDDFPELPSTTQTTTVPQGWGSSRPAVRIPTQPRPQRRRASPTPQRANPQKPHVFGPGLGPRTSRRSAPTWGRVVCSNCQTPRAGTIPSCPHCKQVDREERFNSAAFPTLGRH